MPEVHAATATSPARPRPAPTTDPRGPASAAAGGPRRRRVRIALSREPLGLRRAGRSQAPSPTPPRTPRSAAASPAATPPRLVPALSDAAALGPPPTPGFRATLGRLWANVRSDAEYRRCVATMVGSYVGAGIVQGASTGIMLAIAAGSAATATDNMALLQLAEMVTFIVGDIVRSVSRDSAQNAASARARVEDGELAAHERHQARAGWLRSLRLSAGADLLSGLGLAGCAALVGAGFVAGSGAIRLLLGVRVGMWLNRFVQSRAWHSLETVLGTEETAGQRRRMNNTVLSIEGACFIGTQALVNYAAYRGILVLIGTLGVPCLTVCMGAAIGGAVICAGFKLAMPLTP